MFRAATLSSLPWRGLIKLVSCQTGKLQQQNKTVFQLVFVFRVQLWTVAVGSAKGFNDIQKSLLEATTLQFGSRLFAVVLGQRFQHVLEDQFTMYISYLQHWLSGGRWVSAIFFGGCP